MADVDSPRYKCCCNNCHSTLGVKIIGGVHAGLLLLNAIMGFVNKNSATGGTSLFGLAIALVCIGCAFYGLHKRIAALLIPYGVLLLLYAVLCILGGIGIIIVALAGGDALDDALAKHKELQQHGTSTGALKAAGVIGGIVFLLTGALQVWFVTVVLAAYRYLKETN